MLEDLSELKISMQYGTYYNGSLPFLLNTKGELHGFFSLKRKKIIVSQSGFMSFLNYLQDLSGGQLSNVELRQIEDEDGRSAVINLGNLSMELEKSDLLPVFPAKHSEWDEYCTEEEEEEIND